MKKLYRMYIDCGRMGSLEGVFIANEEDVDKEIIGRKIYFGEVLGKHSDIATTITKDNLDILTDDQEFISKFEELRCQSGYNPFHFIEDEED